VPFKRLEITKHSKVMFYSYSPFEYPSSRQKIYYLQNDPFYIANWWSSDTYSYPLINDGQSYMVPSPYMVQAPLIQNSELNLHEYNCHYPQRISKNINIPQRVFNSCYSHEECPVYLNYIAQSEPRVLSNYNNQVKTKTLVVESMANETTTLPDKESMKSRKQPTYPKPKKHKIIINEPSKDQMQSDDNSEDSLSMVERLQRKSASLLEPSDNSDTFKECTITIPETTVETENVNLNNAEPDALQDNNQNYNEDSISESGTEKSRLSMLEQLQKTSEPLIERMETTELLCNDWQSV
jgi:hypothetical protein